MTGGEFYGLDAAIREAERRAKHSGEIRFVIYESGAYYVASDYDLGTFFMGFSDDQVRYATGQES